MEPDIMLSQSCSPPPLDGDGDGGLGSEEDEFGDFSLGMVCSPLGLADATEPPSFLRQTSPAVKPATHQPNSSFSPPAEQTQHTSLHYSNGHDQVDMMSGAFSASVVNSSEEETGFADFTVFTEQAGHPWCCGFTEQWDGKVHGANGNTGKHTCSSGQELITESELGSQHTCKAEEDVGIKLNHCEKRNAAVVQPPQDHHQPQKATEALSFVNAGEEQRISGNTQERRCNCDSLQMISERVPQIFTEDEPASDEQASCYDDFSFEGVSAELEPNVSSLVSGDDPTDDEVEELENSRHSDFFVCSEMNNLSLSESNLHHCNHYMTQETSATSNQSHSGKNTLDKFARFIDNNIEHHRDQEPAQTADTGVQSLRNLPASDSFADFCSAPTQEDEEGLWEDFKDQNVPVEGKTWTHFREPLCSFYTGRNIDEKLENSEKINTRKNNCQASHVQQLIQSSFPEVLVPAVEGEEELLNLGALLTTQQPPESGEVIPELSRALRIQQWILKPYQDFHCSLGLQFQWGGSHTKTSLLRCLGVDTRNIIFMGTKKQPVTVTTYASGLGMLEPIKNSLPAVSSPGPPGSRCMLGSSPHSALVQPSSQLDWSSHGLSRSQEGTSPCRIPHL